MAASPQQFCLRWNNHQSNIVSVFEQLLHSEAFVDVTLAVEGMSLKAHKVVLSACSPYFQAVLASHPDKHPIVILKDVRYGDMRDLLDFMYRGEVSVDQDNLSSFLKVAESLRIKGLTEVNEKKRRESSSSPYLLHQGIAMTSSGSTIPVGSPSAETLKRPLLSPTFGHNKRRRGRPPKISGDESEGETATNSTGDADCSDARTDTEEKAIKVEAEDPKEDIPEETRDGDCRTNGSSRSSGDSPIKDEQKSLKTDSEITTESPGSGNGPVTSDWPNTEYEQDESSHSSSSLVLNPTSLANAIHLPTKHPHTPLPPTVTEIDQLYYTKNLLEAAMLKNPYEALKNDKAFHGSILLETLRAPMKFGFHAVYGNREIDRDISSSPLSPHTSSPLKPSQSSPTSQSPSSRSHNSSNLNSKGQPQSIMSHCIQDNGFKCSKCLQTFTHPSNFHRHYITVHTDRRAHKCHVCGKEFKRKDNMMSHIRSVHRPGKEGHTIFRDMNTVSPSLTRNVSPLQEQLLQQVDKV